MTDFKGSVALASDSAASSTPSQLLQRRAWPLHWARSIVPPQPRGKEGVATCPGPLTSACKQARERTGGPNAETELAAGGTGLWGSAWLILAEGHAAHLPGAPHCHPRGRSRDLLSLLGGSCGLNFWSFSSTPFHSLQGATSQVHLAARQKTTWRNQSRPHFSLPCRLLSGARCSREKGSGGGTGKGLWGVWADPGISPCPGAQQRLLPTSPGPALVEHLVSSAATWMEASCQRGKLAGPPAPGLLTPG